ncbi:LuxR C-terminal-related transcriptional regulator [Rhizobium vallis]|nr:LuxR C-terminal-related transcriptional regulator [Rhizobium vallis]
MAVVPHMKLAPRALNFEDMVRLRLKQHLTTASSMRVTVITAPAGYGKTVTLRQWREILLARGERVAWIELDQRDDDPSSLSRILQQSVIGEGLPADRGSWRANLDASIDGISHLPGRVWLLLDNHSFDPCDGVDEVISHLIDNGPDCLRIVISGRRRPRIPVTRLRIANQLLELSQEQLRYDPEESARFLKIELPADMDLLDHELITAMTRGWPAGLRMTVTMLGRSKRAKDALAALAQLPAEFAEFFAECLATDLTSHQVALLARTSMLDELSLPLCRAVAGAAGIEDLFRRLRSGELFAHCVDEGGTRFQLHPQFRQYLQTYLNERLNEDGKLQNARASAWFAQNGDWQLAVQHAFSAGNTLKAVEWARQCALEEVAKGNLSMVIGWLGQISVSQLMGDGALLAAAGTAYALSLRLDDAKSIAGMIENLIAASPSDPDLYELADYRKSLLIFIAYMSDDGTALLALADEFRSSVSQAWSVLVVGNATIHGHLIGGNIALARGSLQPLPVEADQPALSFSVVCRSCLLALCDVAENRLDEAEPRLRQAYDLAQRVVGINTAPAVLAASLLSFVRYQRNDLFEAELLLSGHLDLIEQTCLVEGLIACYLTLVRIMVSRGDWKSGYQLLERGDALGRKRDWLRLRTVCIAEQIRLNLLQSRVTQARTLMTVLRGMIQARPATDRSPTSFGWRLLRMSEGRLLAAENKPHRAAEIFERQMHEFAWDEQAGLEAGIEYSVSLLAMGRRGPAIEGMISLLARTEPGDIIRPYIDSGAGAIFLVKSAIAYLQNNASRRVSPEYLDRLASALAFITVERPHSHAEPSLAPALTKRERELLNRVQHGMTNKEIATDLDIGLETVKWHLKAIFKKLKVRNRTEAVSVIQAGVIPDQ